MTLTPTTPGTISPSKAPPQHDDLLREQVRHYLTIKVISQNAFAKELDVSSAVLSQWLAGEYPGDVSSFEALLREHIMTRELATKAETLFETATTKLVRAVLATLQRTEGVAVLYGPGGAGRTSGALMYQRDRKKVVMFTATAWSGSVAGVEGSLMERHSKLSWQRSHLSRGAFLTQKYTGTHTLFIVDGAERLSTKAVEWLLDFQKLTNCPLCFIAGADGASFITRTPELNERIGARQVVELSEDAARAAGERLAEGTAPELAADVADVVAKSGSVRKAVAFLRLACDMREHGRQKDTSMIVKAAKAALGMKTAAAALEAKH